MYVIFPFCTRDESVAVLLSQWLNELGGCRGHKAVLWHDKRCDPSTVKEIQANFVRAFDDVAVFTAGAIIDGWPEGANYFFRTATGYLQNKRDCPYFLWMEPDAVPTAEGWLDAIQAEYVRSKRPFMGARVEVADVPLHMSGVGVYPNPIYNFAGEAYRAHDVAFDIAGKDQIVPKAHFTRLIVHNWKHEAFKSQSELDNLLTQHPQMVLFHSDKTGSIIHLMREKNEDIYRDRGTHQATNKDETLQKGVAPTAPGGSQRNVPALPSQAQESSASSQRRTEKCSSEGEDHQARSVREVQKTNAGETASRPSHGLQQPAGSDVAVRDMPLATPQSLKYDIFIRTYPGDFQWLTHCLAAIKKYASGFRKVWVICPSAPWWGLDTPEFAPDNMEWKTLNEECEDGYLSQQIHKLYADVLTSYEADFYLHIDSDVILDQPLSPEMFFRGSKILWYYTPYAAIQKNPWQPVTEKFMRSHVDNEFMRRLPMMIPKWLYSDLREFCHQQHRMIISQYIKLQPRREFSEFNALGAYAYSHARDKFEFVNTVGVELPRPFAKQYWSWGGMTTEILKEINTVLGGDVPCPVSLKPVSNAPSPVQPADGAVKPAGRFPEDKGIKTMIKALQEYANQGPNQRKYVKTQLRYHGLWPKVSPPKRLLEAK